MRLMKLGMLAAAVLISGQSWAFVAKQVPIPSAAMGTVSNATVVLPDSYGKNNVRLPTVYILHGWSGNDTDWTSKTDVGKLADEYNVILVMPDGSYDKWYVDSPVSPNSKYETYIGKEVVEFVDRTYRTVAKKEARAITGLSMGGFGALNVAVNNAATFGAAGSLSGGVDPRDFSKNWGLENALGDHVKSADFWNDKAIVNNVHRFIFSGIDLAIDCGVDDFFIDSNRALHKRMVDLKVPHDYTERPGGHSWDYWSNAIKYQVLFFSTKFSEKLNKK